MLQTREQHLQELFEQARSGLGELTRDQSKYAQLLEGLVLQVSIETIRIFWTSSASSEDREKSREADSRLQEWSGGRWWRTYLES